MNKNRILPILRKSNLLSSEKETVVEEDKYVTNI